MLYHGGYVLLTKTSRADILGAHPQKRKGLYKAAAQRLLSSDDQSDFFEESDYIEEVVRPTKRQKVVYVNGDASQKGRKGQR